MSCLDHKDIHLICITAYNPLLPVLNEYLKGVKDTVEAAKNFISQFFIYHMVISHAMALLYRDVTKGK